MTTAKQIEAFTDRMDRFSAKRIAGYKARVTLLEKKLARVRARGERLGLTDCGGATETELAEALRRLRMAEIALEDSWV